MYMPAYSGSSDVRRLAPQLRIDGRLEWNAVRATWIISLLSSTQEDTLLPIEGGVRPHAGRHRHRPVGEVHSVVVGSPAASAIGAKASRSMPE